jgi:sugar-specific transcriptional regulator TrmB
MMNELTALLRRIGLNEYESRVYSSLNLDSTQTASEISRKAGIPRARVYDVLTSLERKGFVMVSLGRPVSFKAIEPEKALMNYEKQKRKLFEQELKEMNSLKELLKKSFNRKETKEESFCGTWSVSGPQIEKIILDSLKNAKESVLISTSEANALKKMKAFGNKLKALRNRGIEVKFSLSSLDSKNTRKEFKDFSVFPSRKNSRFIVFDNKKVLLFLNEKKEENERALLIESPFIARFLSELISD